jgi:hypothetical protein
MGRAYVLRISLKHKLKPKAKGNDDEGFTDFLSYQLFGSRFRSKCTAQDRRQTAGAGKAQGTDGAVGSVNGTKLWADCVVRA